MVTKLSGTQTYLLSSIHIHQMQVYCQVFGVFTFSRFNVYFISGLKTVQNDTLSSSYRLRNVYLEAFLKGIFCVSPVQNGESRDQSTSRVHGSATGRCGKVGRSTVRVSQALQAQGAPYQVTKETPEGDKVAATAG